MAESLKDKVAIIGMGCTQFGELWDKDVNDLIIDAVFQALNDAGLQLSDIQAVWSGTMFSGNTGAMVASALQLQNIPITRVENACCTGIESIRNAAFGVASKAYDLVLAVGFEKMKDSGFLGLPPLRASTDKPHPAFAGIGSAPAKYALAATRYFNRYGLTPEEGKRTLAKVSVKSHYCGARNPKAHLRREVTVSDVVNAPLIAWPLGLYDCCGVTDGASAAILCRREDVKTFAQNHKDDYITIKGMGLAIGAGSGMKTGSYDYTSWTETEHAARQAYSMAGITNPRKELDMAETHDCFSIAELIACESLGFCGKGQAKKELIDNGAFIAPQFREEVMKKWGASEKEIRNVPDPADVLPINLSGGLKSFGHPVAASGGREIYEIYKQIQGKADDPSRQLKNVRMGLAHNQGGYPGKFEAGVLIVGVPD